MIGRLAAVVDADPPLDLRSHPATRRLVDEPSPLDRVAYKRREDLLDAVISAWTAAFWHRHGLTRCQVLGGSKGAAPTMPLAAIIAPARSEQSAPKCRRRGSASSAT